MIGLKNGLFEFQENCVTHLLDITLNNNNEKTTVIKAPTGAGKTIILIDYIDKYFNNTSESIAFIWICPGQGNLEEQSMFKMIKHLPHINCKNLFDVISSGFNSNEVTFINWELINNKRNKAICENEKKNLYERIEEARINGIKFILIVDEEHYNCTEKSQNIINLFSPIYEIRVSATSKKNKSFNFYEISELDVITSGLITKALYINDGVQSNISISNEHEYLIDLANKKRLEILQEYIKINKKINPLIMIQFPDLSQDLIKLIEKKLENMGYTYENGLVAKWMSADDEKINKDGIENIDSKPVFLLMKQAISTGWDCPRAKILVKLRENMHEDFTIQTIGRLRRMPEAKHYNNELLDNCYLYTFDKKYHEIIKKELNNAFDIQRVFLKEKCKTFTLKKQLKDLDNDGLGERESYIVLYKFFKEKYKLTNKTRENKLRLEANNYIFGDELRSIAKQGKFIETESILRENNANEIVTRREVNTHKNGIDLMHSINAIKTTLGIKQSKLRAILEKLFRKYGTENGKLLKLDTKEFYAFIINNEELLKRDFKDATSQLISQSSLVFNPKEIIFKIPEQDLIKYDSLSTNKNIILSNAYNNYTEASIVDGIRSLSERLFERYCENNKNVDWVYKNGDTGQQYFSIVYIDTLQKQWLFYPDYIVKLKNNDIWLIETKGGESKDGKSKNIDKQVENKFEAFKKYAADHNLNWGFVRDKNEHLKINNTKYIDNMSDINWKDINKLF